MPISEVLKGFRDSSYGKDMPEEKEEDSSERVLELSPEEAKTMGPEGGEVSVQVSGRYENGCIYVSSVQGSGKGQDVNADAEAVMAKMRPTQAQTIPSPS